MTFAIVARCPRTGQLGVGVTSFSLGVGAYCPLIRTGIGALTSQSYSNPRLKQPAMKLLEEGRSPAEIFDAMRELDPHFDYRQIGIVSADGKAAGWTGPKARTWHGQIIGAGYVALGNALASSKVVDAIAAAYEAQPDLDLHERILLALEGGRDAGGQQYPVGPPLPERSAVLVVHDTEQSPMIDIRVDAHDTALTELRRVRDAYRPFVEYYTLRSNDPPNTPTHQVWMERRQAAQ